MAKKKDSDNDMNDGFDQVEIGDQVRHEKWGVGTVLYRSGSGDHAKAIVVFPDEGQKKLMLKFARLKKVGTTSLKSVERLKQDLPEAPKPKARPKVADIEGSEIDLDVDADEVDLEAEVDEDDVVGFEEEEDDDLPARDEDES